MTEQEWMECTDPTPMLQFLRTKVSDRRLRLFACACCRHVWNLLHFEGSRTAVSVAEKYADGIATASELQAAQTVVEDFHAGEPIGDPALWVCWPKIGETIEYRSAIGSAVEWCILMAAFLPETSIEFGADYYEERRDNINKIERILQYSFLRCISGNPFRPVTIEPRWLTSTVVDLANAIYDDRAFDRMPILGDALMDAGCDNDEIIAHCRSDSPHVRGCWVVDLLIGKD